MILTVPLFAVLLTGLEKAADWWARKQVQEGTKEPKWLFIKYWGIIFVCYLPLFLHWWPVNFVFDAKYQMQEVITGNYKIHHPLLHTLMMGKCYELGQKLGSVNLGISFYTIIQMLVLTAAFAYTMVYLYKKRIPKIVRVIILIFYALFPMNPIFAITATKDVLFAAFFLFFFVLLVKICHDQEKLTWQKVVGLLVSGVLMVLFRRNAMYALLLALPFLIWARSGKRNKIILTILLLGCVLLSSNINDAVIRSVNATNDDSIQESMSVPLQQVARVASYRKEDLDDELYQELLVYWDESVLASYNPYLSDGIKNNVDEVKLESNIINFWKLWGKIGLRFPGEYLESFMTNTLGYWYLGDVAYPMASGDDVTIYHTLIGMGEEITKTDYFPPAAMIYDNLFYSMEYRDVPILGYSFRCCVYFWLLLVYALFVIYRKEYKNLLPVMLIFAYQASCFLGPWVILRYVYSIVVCSPVVIMLGLEKPMGKSSKILKK